MSIRIEAEEGTSLDPRKERRCPISSYADVYAAAVLSLIVKYTEAYPDEIPDLSLQILEAGSEEDALTPEEQETLLTRLREVVGRAVLIRGTDFDAMAMLSCGRVKKILALPWSTRWLCS